MEIVHSIPSNVAIFVGIAIGLFVLWFAYALIFGRGSGGDGGEE